MIVDLLAGDLSRTDAVTDSPRRAVLRAARGLDSRALVQLRWTGGPMRGAPDPSYRGRTILIPQQHLLVAADSPAERAERVAVDPWRKLLLA